MCSCSMFFAKWKLNEYGVWCVVVVCSRELVYNVSEAVSYELRGFYNDDIRHGVYGQSGLSCFSPVINIMRHPLWGRNQVW